MFSNWFQQAKDLVSPPSIQMGQPLSNSESTTKKKKVDEDMTEEGFVCVGRSSFYSSQSLVVEQPAVPYSSAASNQNMPNSYLPYPPIQFQSSSGFSQMYPQLPTPILNMHQGKPSDSDNSSLDQLHECLKHVPFVLHPNLRPNVKIYDPMSENRNVRKSIDWSQFDYDFDFERRVLHEIQQCYSDSR